MSGFKSFIFFILFASCGIDCFEASTCSQKDVSNSYLDVASDMISKAKNNILTCSNQCLRNETLKAVDCAELFDIGFKKSGVYEIWPVNRLTEGKSLSVYCDMDISCGGWTVIQRRGDFNRAIDYFYKDWKSYKEGFGDIEKDFWLGNDNIYALTNQKLYSARFDLRDVEGNYRFALYDKFWIENENQNYTLYITDYSGNAGDSMVAHNNKPFSTKDRDNDNRSDQNCAQNYKGGWWYDKCHTANLNGLYYKGKHKSFATGVNWYTFKNYHESLEFTEIKIRPKNFRCNSESISIPDTFVFNGLE